MIKYAGRTVVCDAGVHPAFSGMAALPFLDELDWKTVDAILITHFHLDHAASLTYVMEKVIHFCEALAFNATVLIRTNNHRRISKKAREWSTCHIQQRQSIDI